MSGFELTKEFNEKRELLDVAIRELKKRGQIKAQAEHDYKVDNAKLMFTLREKDNIPVTIIKDMCMGDQHIAKLRMERDLAKSMYESNQQKIYQLKLEIGIIERQISTDRHGQ